MVTVRFLAPAFYRKHIPGVSKEDDPATVIGCLASTVGCQVSLLTGGRWEVATHPHGRILIGHLKVAEELAQRLAKVSGTQALFVAVLQQASQKEVAWLPRAKQETEAYFRQSLTRAQAAKMPLVLRHRHRWNASARCIGQFGQNLGIPWLSASLDKSGSV